MKRMGQRIALAWCCGLLVGAAAGSAKEAPATDDKAAMLEMLKAMKEQVAEATTPGPHHQALARFIGEWDVDFILGIPGMPKQTSKGKAKYEWLIEGRWVSQRTEGPLMGMPYTSFAILGFDNHAKNHVVATVSSFDTALLVARGVVVDPAGKVTSAYGTLDEYMTGEIGKPFKVVTRIVDDDHHTIEVWDLGIGAEGAMVLEFRFRRKKA